MAFLIIHNTYKYTKRLQSLIYIGCFYYYRGANNNKDTLYFIS